MDPSELPQWTETTRREMASVGDLTTPEAREKVIQKGPGYSIETLVAIVRRLDRDDPRHERALTACLRYIFYVASESDPNSAGRMLVRRIRVAARRAYPGDALEERQAFYDNFLDDYLYPAVLSTQATHRYLEERFWRRLRDRLRTAVRAVRRARRIGLKTISLEDLGGEPAAGAVHDPTSTVAFQKALEKLPEHEQRTVLLWFYGFPIGGADPQSIAAVERISRRAVHERLKEAGKRLTELLGEPVEFLRRGNAGDHQNRQGRAVPEAPPSREEDE